MSMSYLPRRLAVGGICLLALLIALSGCGGSNAPATNAPSSANTDTATVGVTATETTPSPTSTQAGATPTQAKPSPTPTRAKPTPTATRTTPTPTPTRSTPTPTPTPKPSPSPTPTIKTVTIVDNGGFGFSPQTLPITAGTTIIWKNNTSAPHTVTSDNGAFDSGTIQPGGTFTFKFTSTGTFAYHCDIHPYMTASITVH